MEALNNFKNKVSTEAAIQTFAWKLQHATGISTNTTEVFSDPTKAYDQYDQ